MNTDKASAFSQGRLTGELITRPDLGVPAGQLAEESTEEKSSLNLLHLPSQSQPLSRRASGNILVRQSVGGGRSKHVEVEIKHSRSSSRGADRRRLLRKQGDTAAARPLTSEERATRQRVLAQHQSTIPSTMLSSTKMESISEAPILEAPISIPPASSSSGAEVSQVALRSTLSSLPASESPGMRTLARRRKAAEAARAGDTEVGIAEAGTAEAGTAEAGTAEAGTPEAGTAALMAESVQVLPDQGLSGEALPDQALPGQEAQRSSALTSPDSLGLRNRELAELQRIQDEQRIRYKALLPSQETDKGDSSPAVAGKIEKRSNLEFSRTGAAQSIDEDEKAERRKGRKSGGHGRGASTPHRDRSNIRSRDASDDQEGHDRLHRSRMRRRSRTIRAPQPKVLRRFILPDTITVRELAKRMAERGRGIIRVLSQLGVDASLDHTIDAETAELVAAEFGHSARRVSEADVEGGLDSKSLSERSGAEADGDWLSRPPVVTVMGHVDHGKTSLLDALRHSDVAGREAGNITQHIGAYQVTLESERKITFVDTPGHAAFTAMRARGSQVTDIVVLVVAADDGVKAQTLEAIQHASAAQTPIVVAINKIDLPQARPARVRRELTQHGLLTEDVGGDILCVEVSATKRLHLNKLEDAILLNADLLELHARAQPPAASGIILESRQERGRGAVGTFLVQHGTLKVGDILVAGQEWGRVKSLFDDRGQAIDQALPSAPVEVLGLGAPPAAGDQGVVVATEQRAKAITAFRRRKKHEQQALTPDLPAEQLFLRASGQTDSGQELPLVIKGDARGSVEAIRGALEQLTLETEEVKVKVVGSGVGAISESDITLAQASRALLIGFNVRANPQACELAKRERIDLRYYALIYDVIEEVKAILGKMLPPTRRERIIGTVQVVRVFTIHKVGKVAGCRVTSGHITRGAKMRVVRDHEVIRQSTLKTLKRFKEDVREVRAGQECGVALEGCEDIHPGDVLEAFEVEEQARTL